ncbi:hypothetical protein KDH_12070 [Dictyobacter sp. S3.2.2.5]|uniref:Uncharacterized protein n=1 Tax=Dictyobacter halimunensis TaxID=3026934 RepID=A0ABQ6FPA7_9CHLR|nr:hypothetical protein KDH_12070 [Dictyobacter sp. S3.2.2.5]
MSIHVHTIISQLLQLVVYAHTAVIYANPFIEFIIHCRQAGNFVRLLT